MKRWRTRALLLAGGAALAIAIPAFGQRDKGPQSLLPPGFGEPATVPKEKAPPAPATTPSTPAPAPGPGPTGVPAAATPAAPAAPGTPTTVESDEPAVDDSAAGDLEAQAQNQPPPAIEIP